MPVGAVLGEVLRIHAGGQWQATGGGGLCVVLPVGDGTATAHPFEKVVKQASGGASGDIAAHVATARGLGSALPEPETA